MTHNPQNIEFVVVPHWSKEYREAIYLRYKLLRQPLGLKYTKAQMESETEQIHIIGKINDQIVACLCLVPSPDNSLKMRQVCVTKEFQGSGIGRKLVIYSEYIAKQRGYQSMFLNARDYVTSFYLKLDYQIISDKFLEIGIPHYKMTKDFLIL
jgi:predicted GNAT family N-acyltransferase